MQRSLVSIAYMIVRAFALLVCLRACVIACPYLCMCECACAWFLDFVWFCFVLFCF